MLEALEAWAGFLLVLIFIGTTTACLLMGTGAKMAGIKNLT